ncbi:S4 domain-containing protein YaaA [Ammoniphilus sp. CFH 90114]|uniref:S4 domain-containing protein YaaA n=1 Tax=Ammoniphilus sp. CFH 90114 TaxID=2493665 RepID=UPI00100E7FB9|nr:S4 domain-containing protein YaaA [Ammoniphilus sp. CFH 90114]RXT08901.1 S4 domain-containing protein YaaA [Ammoniphilus sp. CFH 90114]
MNQEMVHIRDEYITLGQFIKLVGLVDTGGQVKVFLEEAQILVNDEPENRRGKKLYPEDRIEIEGTHSYVIGKSS